MNRLHVMIYMYIS